MSDSLVSVSPRSSSSLALMTGIPQQYLEAPQQLAADLAVAAQEAMMGALEDTETNYCVEDAAYTCEARLALKREVADAYWQVQKISPLERDEFDAVVSEELTRLLVEDLVNQDKGYSGARATVATSLRVGSASEIDFRLYLDFCLKWPAMGPR